ncbi:histidine phosphatase family protein [Mesorhizobium sp. NBSH29]|uniref:histidine phosphatase family protein n=1 Tax=Mesorhizobium sp. NBSH29 TaxID=2654249 RepID=UPI0018967F2D|nr:histidine phosphatase family protein [Mesorhizobium sp. NBSH29]QPC86126.1 histidine phosphatase family protein [Mesorhizobium sp. NBSH29]
MIGFYLTHPQVNIDPSIPVPDWSLSDLGRERLAAVTGRPWVASLAAIFSSAERKALESAAILVQQAGCEITTDAKMGENDREATGFLPPDRFEKAADWFFAHPDESYRGWETARHAQNRIVERVESALQHHSAGDIAFVGHGGVGTLLKCHLGGFQVSRSQDQHAGGGCIFAFSLSQRRLLCDWTQVEIFERAGLA